jgi:signal peptidase II
MNKNYTLPTSIFAIATLLILLLDQTTKHLIRTHMQLNEIIPILGNFITLTHTNNTGASFSILTNYSFLLGVIATFTIIAIILFYRKIPGNYRFAFAFILAGTAGNLIDRIRFGAVTDFVNISIWPIFNVADLAITIAAIMLIITVWREEKK